MGGQCVRNFAVKFALLKARITAEKPDAQAFIELDPPDMLAQYRQLLTVSDRGVLLFGFSDSAILAILDEEFEIDPDRSLLLFRKTFLDARSIRLASPAPEGPDGERIPPREQALMEHISIRLLELTRHLYRYDMHDARLEDIRLEYEESIRSYMRRSIAPYEPGHAGVELILRSMLASDKSLRSFCNAMTADALFKADAAKLLFGESSAYCQAWQRKQIFRHMIAKALASHMSSCRDA
jgi:hypothetical protein